VLEKTPSKVPQKYYGIVYKNASIDADNIQKGFQNLENALSFTMDDLFMQVKKEFSKFKEFWDTQVAPKLGYLKQMAGPNAQINDPNFVMNVTR